MIRAAPSRPYGRYRVATYCTLIAPREKGRVPTNSGPVTCKISARGASNKPRLHRTLHRGER